MKARTIESISWTATLALALCMAAPASGAEAVALQTQKEKRSYAIGADMARNLKRQGIPLDAEALLQGMRDVLTDGKSLMSQDELREILRAYQMELRQRQLPRRGEAGGVAEVNRQKGAAFLAENKTKEGVVALPSGLQYQVLKAGSGPKPAATDTVECLFRGTLVGGQEFNSTERNGKPATFKMSEVMPGWKEALQLMPVGSKWRLFIPPQLAYGEKGMGAHIGPNETLVFELELVGIEGPVEALRR